MLYVAYNAPHYPMHAPQKYLDRFPHLPWDRRIMAAMISAVDDGVGEIRAELERQGLTENTLIYYQSDNGPSRESRNWMDGREDPYYGGSSGIFTGHKFSLFEGGIRIPAIAAWPGHIPAGRVIDSPHASMDVFPTVLQACGGDASGYEIDGESMLDMLLGGEEKVHDELFWEMDGQTAMRQGDYKLVLNGVLEEHGEPRAAVWLSDLSCDPGEKRNIADEKPEIAAEMTARAQAWRADLEALWAEKYQARYRRTT